MSILPLLELRSRRGRGSVQDAASVGRAFGDGMLTLDDLKKRYDEQQAKMAQQTFENEQTLADAERRDRQLDQTDAAYQLDRDQFGLLKGKDDRAAADEARALKTKGISDVVRGARGRGIMNLHDLVTSGDPDNLTAQFGDMGHEEIDSEFARQKAEEEDLTTKAKMADAALINAKRPRVASNPKLPGLSAAERETVATTEVQHDLLSKIEQSVMAEKSDPGPISNFLAGLRRQIGMRNVTDDVEIARLASVVNTEMNRLYGAALSEHELARAMQEMPQWKDNNEGFLAMLRLYKQKVAATRNKTVDVAGRNARVITGKATVEDAFPPIGGEPAAAAPTPAPAPAPVSRKQKALGRLKELMDSGMDLATAQRTVMSEMIGEMAK